MHFFIFIAVFLFAVPALAQGTITVIGSDGSKKSVKIDNPLPPASSAERAAPNVVVKTTPANPTEVRREGESVIFSAPRAATAEDIPEAEDSPVSAQPEILKPSAEEVLAAPPQVKVVQPPKPKPVPPIQPQVTEASAPPKAAPLPAESEKSPYELWNNSRNVERVVPPEGGISKDQALQIAIDHAPPARDFKILQSTYEHKPVYLVAFKTDSGEQMDILVDMATGAVIKP